MSFLNDLTLDLVHRGLDAGLHRQNVLASNVANIDTPGYVPKDVDFEAALESVGEAPSTTTKTHDKHLTAAASSSRGAIRTHEAPDRAASLDGNQVDLDTQMSRVAQNAITYQANLKVVSKKLAILKYAASEGGF